MNISSDKTIHQYIRDFIIKENISFDGIFGSISNDTIIFFTPDIKKYKMSDIKIDIQYSAPKGTLSKYYEYVNEVIKKDKEPLLYVQYLHDYPK